MSTFALVIREPGQSERRVTLTETIDAGREVDGLLLADEQVSRRHLRFSVSGDTLSVTDLGSTNGTRVGDRNLTEVQPLEDGEPKKGGHSALLTTRAWFWLVGGMLRTARP